MKVWESRARCGLRKDGFVQGHGKVIEVGLVFFVPKEERNFLQMIRFGQPFKGVLTNLGDLQPEDRNTVIFTSECVRDSGYAT